MYKAPVHPTKRALIDVMVGLLDASPGVDVRVDKLLEKSGVSRGSLYHHFADYAELVEVAKVQQFSRYVDATTTEMSALLETITSLEGIKLALREITRQSQGDSAAASRALRARIISEAEAVPRFRDTLQLEIDRLTDSLEQLVTEAMNRGWFADRFTPRTIALFIQAYSLGKILNDFSYNRVSDSEWNSLIDAIIESLFIAN